MIRKCATLAAALIIAASLLGVISLTLSPRSIDRAWASPSAELRVCAAGCVYTNVQAAIDSASDGDVIKIATGVYTKPAAMLQLGYITKSLTLRGGYNPPDWTVSDPTAYTTTLDAEGAGRVMVITGSITVTLDGLRLTNGYWTGKEDVLLAATEEWYDVAAGGGVRVQGANLHVLNTSIISNQIKNGLGAGVFQWYGSLTLSNSVVQSNTTDGKGIQTQPRGGGLCLFQATVSISDSAVLSNTAARGTTTGMDIAGGGLYLHRSAATIQHTLFKGNTASAATVNSLGAGGGLATYRSDLTVLNSTFEANKAVTHTAGSGEGGGLYLSGGNSVISGSLFLNNYATTGTTHGEGGGLFASGALTITGNTLQGNTACTGGTSCDGGGARLSGQVVFQNNTVISNTAGTGGGGVYLSNNSTYLDPVTISVNDNLFQGNTVYGGAGVGNGGGLYTYGSPIDLIRNTIQDNQAGAYGGGLMQNGKASSLSYSPTDLQAGNIIRGNSARYGGGLAISSGYVGTRYQNQVIVDNQASVNGSGLYFDHGGTYVGTILNFYHLTLGRNTGGDGTAIYVNQGAANFVNTLIYSQVYGVQNVSSRTPTFDHTLRYQVLTPTYGAIGDVFAVNSNPAVLADGYHFTGSSAAIDAGTSTPVTDDVDGNVRPRGLAPDIGAVESPYTRGIAPGFQASKQAGAPHWVMDWDPIEEAITMVLEQDYLIPFSYGGTITSPAISALVVRDDFPAQLQPIEQMATPAMSFAQQGSQLTWRSITPLPPNSTGWIGVVGRSDAVQPGDNLSNSATLVYSLTTGQTNTIALQAGSQVPSRPLLPPLLIEPKDGEMCLDENGQLQASGLTHAGGIVQLYEDGQLKATTTADSASQFTVTWTSVLTFTSPYTTVNVYAVVCDPAQPTNCSAPSRSVKLEYPQGYWCPQRSYWEGDADWQHYLFHFVNEQGRYATNDFQLPGVFGFWNTRIHLYSCCDSDTNPFVVRADNVVYSSPVEHVGRMWTFNIGPAHDVSIQTNCLGGSHPTTGTVLIDPDGYVFDQTRGGQYHPVTGMFSPTQALAGITVTAYVSVPEWGGWLPWPAQLYNDQINPQVTGNNGYFAFFTPPGFYYLQAEGANGYQAWRSPVVQVITQIMHVNMPLTPWSNTALTTIDLTPDGPDPSIVNVPPGGSVEWRSILDASATITDLVRLSDQPVNQPRTMGVLDPLVNVLGFDGGLLKPGQTYRRQFTQRGTYAYTDGLGHTGTIVVGWRVYLPLIRK